MKPPHAAPAPARGRGTAPRRPPGIALLMALAVVMLMTFFMSEFFFATGLELRSMTTFKDAQQARMLAGAVFKAVQVGLLQDEVEFFKGYGQLASVLELSPVPWSDGFLVSLEIAPQDALYNLNNSAGQQPASDTDVCRYAVFRQTLEDVLQARAEAAAPQADPDAVSPAELYAAIFDWLDKDDQVYVAIPGVLGAEADAYYNSQPEYGIKNAELDRLSELRLVRGYKHSGLVWGEWERRFTALPRVKEGQYCNYSERLNVNLADAQTIESYLKARYLEPGDLTGASNVSIQAGINEYVDKAETIAQEFAPDGAERRTYTSAQLRDALKALGVKENIGAQYLFSTIGETYRVRAVTEFGGVRARLEGMLSIPRDADTRWAKGAPKVLWETIE